MEKKMKKFLLTTILSTLLASSAYSYVCSYTAYSSGGNYYCVYSNSAMPEEEVYELPSANSCALLAMGDDACLYFNFMDDNE